jgi:AAA domain/RepB DNA-primase N-terminal domain
VSVRVRDVITAIFDGCAGLLELRAKSSAGIVRTAFVEPSDVDAISAFVTAHRDDDVWFGVATRRDASSGALANCSQLSALFIDVDCHGDAQQLAVSTTRLLRFALPPSIIIRSGAGLHAYWLLKEPADVQVERVMIYALLRRLAAALDGDRAAAEPARVLRLPGTFNHKHTPKRSVTIQTFLPGRRYNLSEFDEFLPADVVATTGRAPAIDLSQPILEGMGRNDAVYKHGRGVKLKGAPDAEVAASMRTLNQTFCKPPMDPAEMDRLVANVLRQPDRVDAVRDVELEASPSVTRHAVLTRLADIEAQSVEYVWPGRIARGRLNLLIGDPGLGKSFVSLDVAARVTRGQFWPDGGIAPTGDVIVLSAEDNAADTIRPRADALGADVARIHILSAIRTGDAADQDQQFSLVTDLPLLEVAIVETGAILVNIDPVSAYLGTKLDSYKDAHVRSVFGPLAALAERRNVAIVGIMHLSKGTDRRALYRALGSVAFVAAARLVLAVAPHPDDDDARVLVPVKSNICAPAATLAYRLTDGVLTWSRDPVLSLTADQLLSAQVLDRHERQDAADWLRTVLADGQVPVTILQQEAKAAGMAWRTVERAKAQLGVDAVRLGGLGAAGQWCWFLKPKSATVLALVPKSATVQEVAVLGADSINTLDLTATDAKTATFHTVADLGVSAAESEAVAVLDADAERRADEDGMPLPVPPEGDSREHY